MRITRCRESGIKFFLAGLLITMWSLIVQMRGQKIADHIFGVGVKVANSPALVTGVISVITWLPLATAVLVVTLRIVKGKRFRALAFILGMLTLPALGFASISVGPRIVGLIKQRQFDSAVWIAQEGQSSNWPARLRMVDDLIERRLLDGKNRESILTLLGPSDTSGYWSDWDVHYWLGPERRWPGWDSEWLVIKFDEKDRIVQYKLVSD